MSDQPRQLLESAKRVDLKQEGYKDSASNQGSIAAYEQFVESVATGELIDRANNLVGLDAASIQQIVDKIKQLESKKDDKLKEIKSLNQENKDYQNQKKELEMNPKARNFFRITMLGIMSSVLLIFLFYFYSGVGLSIFNGAYRGVFIPLNYFLKVFARFPGVLFLPVIFTGFAIGLHFVNEWEDRMRRLGASSSLVVITFLADLVGAYLFHDEYLKTLDNPPVSPFYTQAHFWIIILLGFVSFILFSLMFHLFVENFDLKSQLKKLSKLISKLENQISRINSDMESLERQIVQLNNDKIYQYLPADVLKNNIIEYTNGWILGINGMPGSKQDENEKLVERIGEKKNVVINRYVFPLQEKYKDYNFKKN